ncbi:MAG: DUF4340 domain-containing protein [Verrucomicrobiales bacterium]|nr:DUF4340 domain-containing protein [Verrucomicrobiales bacterium]
MLTLAVLGTVWWLGKRAGTEERESVARQTLRFTPAEVTRLELVSAKGACVFDKDTRGAWQIQSPVKYPANNAALAELLSQLSFAECKAVLPAERLGDLDQFGLKTPETLARLRLASGAECELALGRETAVAGDMYARVTRDGVTQYLVVAQGTTLAALLQKDLARWRSGVVFDFTADQVRGLMLHQESKDVAISKDGAAWQITKPLTALADSDAPRVFLAQLLALRATQFVTDNPAEYANYNLNSPYLVLTVNLDGGRTVTLRVGRVDAGEESQYYAQQTALPAVFVITKETVDFLANLLDEVRGTIQ